MSGSEIEIRTPADELIPGSSENSGGSRQRITKASVSQREPWLLRPGQGSGTRELHAAGRDVSIKLRPEITRLGQGCLRNENRGRRPPLIRDQDFSVLARKAERGPWLDLEGWSVL
jgi:hypothetical protein